MNVAIYREVSPKDCIDEFGFADDVGRMNVAIYCEVSPKDCIDEFGFADTRLRAE